VFRWDRGSVASSAALELTEVILFPSPNRQERCSIHVFAPQAIEHEQLVIAQIAEWLELTAQTHPGVPDSVYICNLRDARWSDFPTSIDRFLPDGISGAAIGPWCTRLAEGLRAFCDGDGRFVGLAAEHQQACVEARELLVTITEIRFDGRRYSPPLVIS
jgi:hypothetical protein